MNFQNFAITIGLFQGVISVNLKNNECSKISEYHLAPFSPHCRYNPDVLSDVPNMIKNNGYNVDTHTVTTSSGYILNLYRVRSEKITATGYPIIAIHGIAIETGTWTNIGNRSLAFNLVEAGYDVWLGSLRGTADSKKHTTWNINNPAYWSFSLDESAKEDVGAQVTYIFKNTSQKVVIIGHSMGTTLSLMYASEYVEEANQVLRGIVTLAPVIYFDFALPAFKYLHTPVYALLQILDVLHIRGLLYEDKLVHHLIVALCKILPEMCYELAARVAGKTEQFLPDDLLSFWSYWPSGTSVRQLKHFLQIKHYKSFQKYDFGTERENIKHYNTSKPPLYNLGNVQVPVCVYYGRNDIFYQQENVDRFYNELGTSRKFITSTPTNVSENLQFAHIDFVNSKNIIEYMYVPLLEKLETFFN